ncbi:MAG: hypothetical protein V4469_03890 [Patescibacteria group bacterium]
MKFESPDSAPSLDKLPDFVPSNEPSSQERWVNHDTVILLGQNRAPYTYKVQDALGDNLNVQVLNDGVVIRKDIFDAPNRTDLLKVRPE